MPAPLKDLLNSIGLLILRLGICGFMLTHGWGKLQMLLDGKLEIGDPIGLGAGLSKYLIVAAEFVCPILIILGLATRFAAIGPVIAMAVAAFIVHANDPWTMGAGASKEPALLFLIPFLALAFTGAGRLSLDACIESWWSRRHDHPAGAPKG